MRALDTLAGRTRLLLFTLITCAALEGAAIALLALLHGNGAETLGPVGFGLGVATVALATSTTGFSAWGLSTARGGSRRLFAWALGCGLAIGPLAVVGGLAARSIARLAESPIFPPVH